MIADRFRLRFHSLARISSWSMLLLLGATSLSFVIQQTAGPPPLTAKTPVSDPNGLLMLLCLVITIFLAVVALIAFSTSTLLLIRRLSASKYAEFEREVSNILQGYVARAAAAKLHAGELVSLSAIAQDLNLPLHVVRLEVGTRLQYYGGTYPESWPISEPRPGAV